MFNIDKNIDKARTLPSQFYIDDSIFIQSKNIFKNSIQPICSISKINKLKIYPFLYFPKFLDENLLITNDGGDIKCLSNVCTHRGHLVSSCDSNAKLLQCRYHGRTFDLNGKLKNAPGFENALDFPTKSDNLDEVSIFNWHELLFISLSKDKIKFKKLDQIDKVLPDFPYKDLCKIPIENEYIIKCHWALYCDNYLEGFHIPYVHKGLNNDMKWNDYETIILDEIVLQKAISKNNKDIIPYDNNNNIYAYYFFIFPNIMINYYKWGISINIIEPISKNETRIKYMMYNLKQENIPLNSPSSLDIVELEDQEVVLNVQKGVESKYYKSGRFSPDLEQGVHYFHRLISKKLFNLS